MRKAGERQASKKEPHNLMTISCSVYTRKKRLAVFQRRGVSGRRFDPSFLLVRRPYEVQPSCRASSSEQIAIRTNRYPNKRRTT
jgi:hypothetical protein